MGDMIRRHRDHLLSMICVQIRELLCQSKAIVRDRRLCTFVLCPRHIDIYHGLRTIVEFALTVSTVFNDRIRNSTLHIVRTSTRAGYSPFGIVVRSVANNV